MSFSFRKICFGSPLATEEEVHQRLTKTKALAVFSSDALSSVAYATEEILHILVLAGIGALHLSVPIGICITALLLIVSTSYYQTILGYPTGASSYIVASKNLGTLAGLMAGAALLLDYVLTVAVSISAGAFAIVSAFPMLAPFRVKLCLVLILLIAWSNLRGLRESSTIFSIPTYAFIATTFALILTGTYQYLNGTLVAPPALPEVSDGAMQAISLFLILRAFSSGCAALTGIEAISDGIMAFQKPEARNAARTLAAMAVILALMFVGITFLARVLHVGSPGTELEFAL